MRATQGTGRAAVPPANGRAGALALALWMAAAPAGAQPESVRLIALEPARTDSAIVCTVITSGLPDAPMRETLASGLPSSLTLSLTLLDGRGRERAGATAEVRIEPDPWERTFVVRMPWHRARVAGLEALSEQLGRIGPVPVLPLSALASHAPVRLRARLAVHPLAPAEADRARALFVGDLGPGGGDRREVSAGLGSLLQFFLGRTPNSGWRAQATSAPFEPRALERVP